MLWVYLFKKERERDWFRVKIYVHLFVARAKTRSYEETSQVGKEMQWGTGAFHSVLDGQNAIKDTQPV